jgi:hypothetical protein
LGKVFTFCAEFLDNFDKFVDVRSQKVLPNSAAILRQFVRKNETVILNDRLTEPQNLRIDILTQKTSYDDLGLEISHFMRYQEAADGRKPQDEIGESPTHF